MAEERRSKERKDDLELLRRRAQNLLEVLEKDSPAAVEVGDQLGRVLMAALPFLLIIKLYKQRLVLL